MDRIVDRLFCGLLAFGAAGHLLGTFLFAELWSALFVWSLAGVLAAALLVALNVVRSFRPGDRAVAWIALAGTLCWVGIAGLFGISIGNLFDPRVLVHAAAAVGLSYFNFRAARV
ncbi:MAG: hypothetical protein HY852_17245 [Bradyrhizobium sp.]|uniref:hypothetical protein n=1 Tax=Bradyrhizobium sp. TaxID=376 RepID=UPI0025B880D3|nr:hypothetical protein [Bradyrhizobium sp.]MBI5263556.1 hypothetical protein [Bradyrhizobium sp.]